MLKNFKKISTLSILLTTSILFTACGNKNHSSNESSKEIIVEVNSDLNLQNVNFTFWNPITGPDATYMQDLVKEFNDAYEGKIKVTVDSQAEDNHYQRILTSFTDNSTADLTMIHKSRIPTFYRANKLRDMTDILASQNIKRDNYVGDIWDSGVFDGKVYGMATFIFNERNHSLKEMVLCLTCMCLCVCECVPKNST